MKSSSVHQLKENDSELKYHFIRLKWRHPSIFCVIMQNLSRNWCLISVSWEWQIMVPETVHPFMAHLLGFSSHSAIISRMNDYESSNRSTANVELHLWAWMRFIHVLVNEVEISQFRKRLFKWKNKEKPIMCVVTQSKVDGSLIRKKFLQ